MSNPDTDANATQRQLADYFEHLRNRINKLARTLDATQLWEKPFPFGNSVGHLVVHLTGSLNHYIGTGVAGSGYVRDRALEFSDASAGQTADEILTRFNSTVEMVIRTLNATDSEAMSEPFTTGGPPVHSRFGLFLVCAGHMSNHIGQMVYLIQAQGYRFDDKVW